MPFAVQAEQIKDFSQGDYEVIIYDAQKIAAINAKPIYPRDISSQFTETVSGVPIIENPSSCERDELDINVTVEGVKKLEGMIVADLHDDKKENFLVWDKVLLRVRVPVLSGDVKFCIPLTQPGEYAVAVYHDKNSNQKFDKNFLGIPKEHFGMSNNPKFGLSSPEYEETAFVVTETGADIRIVLRSAGDVIGGG